MRPEGLPRRFFFYGTLTHAADNPTARALHERLEPGVRAEVSGELHAIPHRHGWYPALVAGGGKVAGHVYPVAADFSAADLARMDTYEHYDPLSPETGEYVRQALEVSVGRGTSIAEAYVYARPLPAGARRIDGGDFAAWLAATGAVAFAPGDSTGG